MSKTWKNFPDTSTPIDADALNYLQQSAENFNDLQIMKTGAVTPNAPWNTGNEFPVVLSKKGGVSQLFFQLQGGNPWGNESGIECFSVAEGFKPVVPIIVSCNVLSGDGAVFITNDTNSLDFIVAGVGSEPANYDPNTPFFVSITYLCED